MQLKEIVKITAMYLGRGDVCDYLEAGNSAQPNSGILELVNNLTGCANLVINELALSYIPMYKEETVNNENGKINYSTLTERVTEIVDVIDDYGNSVEFKVFPEYLETFYSHVKIKYKYIPSNYGLTDNVGYLENQVPARIIAYGTAGEYCLTERGFQESLMWRTRFNDSLSTLLTPKNTIMKSRRFFL